ncbi:MAG: hypothetical protein O7G85_01745 [Planctomycetota bacterium]|nr:hypothetical protein [Planctomycetota bacterium]
MLSLALTLLIAAVFWIIAATVQRPNASESFFIILIAFVIVHGFRAAVYAIKKHRNNDKDDKGDKDKD